MSYNPDELQSVPLGASFGISSQTSFFSFQRKLSLSITQRVSRLGPAPEPIAQATQMLPSPLITRLQTRQASPSQQHLQLCVPSPGDVSLPPGARSVPSQHLRHPIRQVTSMSFVQHPSLSSYPHGVGQGTVVLTGTQRTAWAETVTLLDACACHFLCRDPSSPYHLQLASSADQLLQICPYQEPP